MAEEFSAIYPHSQQVFDGTVMTIDGWVMQTRTLMSSHIAIERTCGVWLC
jgi:hypothetical protein